MDLSLLHQLRLWSLKDCMAMQLWDDKWDDRSTFSCHITSGKLPNSKP